MGSADETEAEELVKRTAWVASDLVHRFHPRTVLVEDMTCMITKRPKLYAVSAAAAAASEALGVEARLLHPVTVKKLHGIKSLGDHHKNKTAALKHLSERGLELKSDHVADAILLALCGAPQFLSNWEVAHKFSFLKVA